MIMVSLAVGLTSVPCAAQMEVGIEDCLHIEFEYNKSRYHLRDTVVGKIYFLLVRPACSCQSLSMHCR